MDFLWLFNNSMLLFCKLIFPTIYVVLTAIITILPMISNPVETSIGIAMILSAFPVYFLFIHSTKKRSQSGIGARISSFISNVVQKLFIAVPEVNEA